MYTRLNGATPSLTWTYVEINVDEIVESSQWSHAISDVDIIDELREELEGKVSMEPRHL